MNCANHYSPRPKSRSAAAKAGAALCLNVLLCLAGLLSGCSFVSRNTIGLVSSETDTAAKQEAPPSEDNSGAPTTVSIAGLEQPGHESKNYVEILWEIPAEPVDEYLLRYGYGRDNMDHESKLAADDVEKFSDSHHGLVYRHVLEGIDPHKSLYLTLQSIKDGQTSAPTEVFEVLGSGG